MQVEIVATEELGDRTYVVHDHRCALVIDPQRDIDRVEFILTERGLRCAVVAETHLHNDYVSGGLELARRHRARYLVAGVEDVAFERFAVADGDTLDIGRLHVRVLATPGHTDSHLSYVVRDETGASAAFTGGSLLYGSVGRTDLVHPSRTEELARAQYRSARFLARVLEDETRIYPTHGFGSFCSSGSLVEVEQSTVAVERRRNDALIIEDEDAFVSHLSRNLTAFPSYYAFMGSRNRQGAGPIDLSLPALAGPSDLASRIRAGEWVVDLRSVPEFAAQHIAGTIGISLGPLFTTYFGWLFPSGKSITLLGEHGEQIIAAQRQLVRIGIDRLDAAAVGRISFLGSLSQLRGYHTATFDDLARNPDALVLDVRRDDERVNGYIRGSLHVPLHELPKKTSRLPDEPIWVHCASGYRAGIAASLLDRAGIEVVLINDTIESAHALLSHAVV